MSKKQPANSRYSGPSRRPKFTSLNCPVRSLLPKAAGRKPSKKEKKDKKESVRKKKESKLKQVAAFFFGCSETTRKERKDAGINLFTATLCKRDFYVFCVNTSIICVCACARVSQKAAKQIKQIIFS